MPVLKNGQIEENIWAPLGEGGEDRPVVVGLPDWVAGRKTLIANFGRCAVRLESADNVEDIRGDLGFIEAVFLVFPKFNDGRAFSQARLLRERYGFKGEIRATGHVIQDQFLFLQRCGVDAVEVADAGLLQAWDRAHRQFKGFYQPALPVEQGMSGDSAGKSLLPGSGAWARIEPAVMASWIY